SSKKVWSSSTLRARSQAASSMKSERFLPSTPAARSIRSRCAGKARRLMGATRVMAAPRGVYLLGIHFRMDVYLLSIHPTRLPVSGTGGHRHGRHDRLNGHLT